MDRTCTFWMRKEQEALLSTLTRVRLSFMNQLLTLEVWAHVNALSTNYKYNNYYNRLHVT